MATLRQQIGEYIRDLVAGTPGNRGGAAYGQPFDFGGKELPFDWVFSGPERFEDIASGNRTESQAQYVVTRLFRHGGERGSLYEIGEPYIAELVQYVNQDEHDRCNSRPNLDLQFRMIPAEATLEAIPEDSAVETNPSTYGAVNLLLDVSYEFLSTDPHSQQVNYGG